MICQCTTTISPIFSPSFIIQKAQPKDTYQRGRPVQKAGTEVHLAQTATVRMAKRKSVHQCACTGNTSRLAIIPDLEKVKTVRCFWEMKIEPEVITQHNPPSSLHAVCNQVCNPLSYQQMSVKVIFLSRTLECHGVFTYCNYFKMYLGTINKQTKLTNLLIERVQI